MRIVYTHKERRAFHVFGRCKRFYSGAADRFDKYVHDLFIRLLNRLNHDQITDDRQTRQRGATSCSFLNTWRHRRDARQAIFAVSCSCRQSRTRLRGMTAGKTG